MSQSIFPISRVIAGFIILTGVVACGGEPVLTAQPPARPATGPASTDPGYPTDSASPESLRRPPLSAPAARLNGALLPVPRGMRIAYGPEAGEYGKLEATQRGLEAMRKARLSRPECAGAGQLDVASPEVAAAPAAVVAFASDTVSITEALVTLPKGRAALPAEPPAVCHSYTATVGSSTIAYAMRRLSAPGLGQESRASLTTTTGSGPQVQLGTGTVRKGNVIMSVLMVGSKIRPAELQAYVRKAYERLSQSLS